MPTNLFTPPSLLLLLTNGFSVAGLQGDRFQLGPNLAAEALRVSTSHLKGNLISK